jgi:hypothetical protein
MLAHERAGEALTADPEQDQAEWQIEWQIMLARALLRLVSVSM